jgi:hypothetical protein
VLFCIAAFSARHDKWARPRSPPPPAAAAPATSEQSNPVVRAEQIKSIARIRSKHTRVPLMRAGEITRRSHSIVAYQTAFMGAEMLVGLVSDYACFL